MDKEIFVAPRASRSTRNMSVRSRGRTFVETGAFLPHEGEGQKVEFDSLGEFDAFTTTSALYSVADMVGSRLPLSMSTPMAVGAAKLWISFTH